jgi:hypothetical protein
MNANLLKKIVTVFIVVLSISFYNLFFVSGTIARVSGFLAALIVIALLVFHVIYYTDVKTEMRLTFTFPMVLMLISPFLSMLIAKYYHGQSIGLSLYAQSPMYLYLFYFLLHRWKVDPGFLLKMIYFLGAIYVGIYFVQWTIYPAKILNTRIDFDRGTVRIFFDGAIYALYAYFLLLAKTITDEFKWKNLVLVLLTYSVIAILQGTRSALVITTASTGLFLLTGKYIKNRYLILTVSFVMAICAFFIFFDIFIGLYELSKEESGHVESNPRLLANKFFLGDFMPANIAYVLGNGADHGASIYGQRVMFYKKVYGYFQSDIGLVGTYSKYGITMVLGYIMILSKFTLFKLPKEMNVVRFMFIGAWLGIFAGSGAYTQPDGVVGYALLAYLIDAYMHKQNIENRELATST